MKLVLIILAVLLLSAASPGHTRETFGQELARKLYWMLNYYYRNPDIRQELERNLNSAKFQRDLIAGEIATAKAQIAALRSGGNR